MAEITKKEFSDILNDFKGDILHQFSIISEDLTTKVQQVAEGVSNLNEKFDRRLDELTGMNDSQHKDILAAIKFSYAELDRRITNLEREMDVLRQRMDKLEHRSVS